MQCSNSASYKYAPTFYSVAAEIAAHHWILYSPFPVYGCTMAKSFTEREETCGREDANIIEEQEDSMNFSVIK